MGSDRNGMKTARETGLLEVKRSTLDPPPALKAKV